MFLIRILVFHSHVSDFLVVVGLCRPLGIDCITIENLMWIVNGRDLLIK